MHEGVADLEARNSFGEWDTLYREPRAVFQLAGCASWPHEAQSEPRSIHRISGSLVWRGLCLRGVNCRASKQTARPA